MSRVSQRYAAALADVAIAHKQSAEVREGLRAFLHEWDASSDLQNFLLSPSVPAAAKRELIEKLGGPMNLVSTVRNFLCVLVDHHRVEILPVMGAEFEEDLRDRLGIARAEVVSAQELTEEEKFALHAALERVTGKKIEARYGQDASLIGGAVVRVGSTVYDGSVREQLNRLQARLEADA